jgi:hypothetical protein
MESAMNPEFLQAAVDEHYRLEARLRSNPDFRRLEAVRRLIALYAPGAEIPVQIDPIFSPEPARSATRPAPTPNPDPSPTNLSSSAHVPSGPQPTSRQGLYTRGNSQSSRIKTAAAEHLVKTRKRATSGEIYNAIVSKGVEVGGKRPAGLVAAELSSSPIFDHTPEGYGLREWSNGGSPQTAAADPVLWPDPRAGISRPTPSSDQRTTVSRPVARSDPPDRTSGRGGWTWGNSKTSRIQAAAEDYLRATGRRARGGEIYRAIASKVEINAKKPAALVSARLTSSALFDRTSEEGYGLREWSDGAAANKNGLSAE